MVNHEEELDLIFNKIESLDWEPIKSLYRVLVVYIGPITQKSDYRVAYFLHAAEASLWMEEMYQTYGNKGMEFSIYSDI